MVPASQALASTLRPLPEGWVLRPRRMEDLPGVVELMRRVYIEPYGPEAVWPEAVLQLHLEMFPEGQFSILDAQGRLLADATAMRISSEWALRPHRWSDITGNGSLATHQPNGDAFYGVDLAVDPDFQDMGLAHHLYAARIELATRLGCRFFVAGTRMPGYHLAADHLTPEGYLALVHRGLIYDPTLSKQLRLGFHFRGLLQNYIGDPESADCAAMIFLEL